MVLVLDGKTDLNQISLTGARALILIGLLALAPHSIEEIREKLLLYNIMEQSQSNDILRVDLNTIKSFGCEISRIKVENEYKYTVTKHPFDVSIDKNDIKILKRLFNKIKNTLELSKLLEIDTFLNKLSEHIYDPKLKEEFYGILPLRHYNKSAIKELDAACANEYTLILKYQKAYSSVLSEKEIVAKKLILNNDKLYLYGYDIEKQDFVTLLFNRIKTIVSKSITTQGHEKSRVTIKFRIQDIENESLTQDENVVEFSEKYSLVEGTYYNEFLAIQRILSFGAKCTVVEPVEFRNKVISKLKEMRKLYE